MSIEAAYHSLLSKTARDIKNADGPAFGAPSNRHISEAKVKINRMSNVQLIKALAEHEAIQ